MSDEKKIGPWVGCAANCGQIPHLDTCPRTLLATWIDAAIERDAAFSELAEVAKILGKKDGETIQDAARRAVAPPNPCAIRGCDWISSNGGPDEHCRRCGGRRNLCESEW